MTTPAWPELATTRLKALWAEGLTGTECASQLSKEFGYAFSRNAVIGKVHRMGWRGIAPAHKQGKAWRASGDRPKRPRKPLQPMVKVQRPARLTASLFGIVHTTRALDQAPGAEALAPDSIPLSQRRCLFELRESHCRFPFGDPKGADFFFCGAAKLEGLPYCATHACSAYEIRPRRSAAARAGAAA
jgi:GcrA cell cycle regulator